MGGCAGYNRYSSVVEGVSSSLSPWMREISAVILLKGRRIGKMIWGEAWESLTEISWLSAKTVATM